MSDALIGREAEAAAIAGAIADPDCAALVLRGPAGAGKTALAHAALAAAEARGALIGAGKYAQGEVQPPFGPIMAALTDLVGRALERLSDPEPAQAAMPRALGPALAVLVQSGFRAASPGEPASADTARTPISRKEAATRIVEASLRLLRWLTAFEAPVVLFLDDWRRGGEEAALFVESMATEAIETRPMVILTERDEAAPDGEGLWRILEIGSLAAADGRRLLRRTLGEAGDAVVDWLGPAVPGLPFDLLATAQALRAAGALRQEGDGWRIDAVAAASLGRQDLARGAVGRLAPLGRPAEDVALATALWGDAAPAGPLRGALSMAPDAFEAAVARVRDEGVLLAEAGTVRFAHDRLREAVLEAGAARSAALAGVLAERLADLAGAGPAAAMDEVGRAALRLRLAGGVEGAEPDRWRDRFARGAAGARAASDMDAASAFAECAWRLRERGGPPGDGADPQGERLLAREAVLAAADRRDHVAMSERLDVLFALASGPEDPGLGETYELAIAAWRLAGDPAAAWTTALEGLARFGLVPPAVVRTRHLLTAVALWRIDRLLRPIGPPAAGGVEPPVDAFTRIANAAAMLAYERSPRLSALLALEGSRRVARAARRSPFWMAADTFLLATLGDWEGAARLGERAAAAAVAPGFSGFAQAAALNRALGWGVAWRRPAAEMRPRTEDVRELAIAEGDLVQAAGAIRNGALSGWRASPSLATLEGEVRQARAAVARLGDADVAASIDVLLAAIGHLRRSPSDAPAPRGAGETPAWTAEIPESGLVVTLELASVHGDWAFARRFAQARRRFRRDLDSNPRTIDWRFHDSLARLKTGAPARRADRAVLRRAARLNPADHLAKWLVVEAETLRWRGAPGRLAAWARAVDAAEAGSSRLVAGVAAEAAAEAARGLGDPGAAEAYRRRAQAIWRAWGATIKLDEAEAVSSDRSMAGELADAHAQAAAAERIARARERFLADVAHELRTPLQSLQGLIDLAADDPARLDLTSLRQVFGSLRGVVDDLTDLGALGSGMARLTTQPVAIAELVRSECAVARPFAAEHGARIEVAVEADVPAWVATDGPRLRQVARNLVSNAVKYGAGTIRVGLTVADSDLRLTVDDEGPGLSQADLLRLFQPFERGARAGDGLGLGLGLALSRRIAVLLGGGLEAENRAGGGARFTLRLPLVAAAPPGPAPAADVRPLRILLAEDAALVRRLFAAILAGQGHGVSEAADGAEAAALLGRGEFDLAILDLSMPVMGGLEVLDRMAGDPHAPPAILLTASGDGETLERARAAGAALVLRKPVSAEELARAVADVAGSRASASAGLDGARLGGTWESLVGEARVELRARIECFVARPGGGDAGAAEAHRIAGLAAQFGWPAIAEIADAIEAACRAGGSPERPDLDRLAAQAASLEPPGDRDPAAAAAT